MPPPPLDHQNYAAELLTLKATRHRTPDRTFADIIETDYGISTQDILAWLSWFI
jgi:hypothetical protein